jgi:hypothetical protein
MIFFIYLQHLIKVNRSDYPVPSQNGSNPFDVDDRLNVFHNCSKLANVIRHNFSREVGLKEEGEIFERRDLSPENESVLANIPPWEKSRPEEDAHIKGHFPVPGDGSLAVVRFSRHPSHLSLSSTRISGSRKPEIGDVRIEEVVVVSSDQDVVRRQVAMTEAHPVNVDESFSDVGKNFHCGTQGDHFSLNG